MEAKRIITTTIIIAALISAASNAGSIRKWTDAEGNVHFGDIPPDSATDVQRYAPKPSSSYSSGTRSRSASDQLRSIRSLSQPERRQRTYNRADQQAQDNYKARTGQDWEGRKEIRRLQKQKESIAHKMRNARGSKASSLREQMRSTDDEISRKQGYRPPSRVVVDINHGRH